ncbi:MAG TPA: Fe-S cluster domain-containing protein [Acidobacteriota bacterium]|nr:Fe-S cluster domain-containing protein [Acidobacteriota bacterium]
MIVNAILTLAALGLLAGLGLGFAARVFAVKVDPRVEEIDAALPQFNCGACGYAGCADYAKAVVEGKDPGLCAPGGPNVAARVAAIMGQEVSAQEKMVAFVFCGGSDTAARKKYHYNGVIDCISANLVSGGDKSCSYGCLGLGTCVHVCPADAILIEDGLARVVPELCIGCRKCVEACPKNVIHMVPASRVVHVVCSSQDKGPVVRKACQVGCIGCRRCTKAVDDEQITMDDNLAVVDYSKPLLSREPVESCPTGAIQIVETEFTAQLPPPAETAGQAAEEAQA